MPTPDGPAPLAVLSTSPFHNTKAGVAYVGDQKCLDCHFEYKSYHDHPMGRSMFPTASAPPLERFEAAAGLAFQNGPFRFQVIREGGKQIHREWCEDAQGKVVAEQRVEMAYSVGSGAQSRAYLYSRGGGLFESPITWYARKGVWDLSPGYTSTTHFTRRIDPKCVYCHAQEVRPVENSLNGYQEPPFGQPAIGCERCHGPGELHVGASRPPAQGEVDYSIVNPRHLSPVLRDAICEQCHLQGAQTVWRRGRSATEYRPGLPLHEYVTVFVFPPELDKSTRIVGQLEQMRQSACFTKSAGVFQCTSCHDPHSAPAAAEVTNFYQQRCRNCHAAKAPAPGRVVAPDCSVPLASRVAPDGRTDCLVCHMPRSPATKTLHLAVTDHRLLRRPDQQRQFHSRFKPGDLMVVPFHQPYLAPDDPDAPRDLGVALADRVGLLDGASRAREFLIQRAGPLLDQAVARDPADVPALEARAMILLEQNQLAAALSAFQDVLARVPDREKSLTWGAESARLLGQLELAERYARRLVERYPYYPANHERLASVLVARKAWPDALVAARAAVRGNPFRPESRELLIAALIETGDLAQARAEFDVVGVIDPPYQTKLRGRFPGRFRDAK